MKKSFILTGSSNPSLAEKLSQASSIPLGKVDRKQFSDGESHICIKEDLTESTVFVLQSGSKPVHLHLFEALQIAYTAKKMGAKKVISLFSFFPYRRQERALETGECISAELVAQLIESSGLDETILCNIHTPSILSFFSKPVKNIELWDAFIPHLSSFTKNDTTVVVAPDKGSVEDSAIIANKLSIPLITAEKYRPSPEKVAFKSIDGDVENKNIILVDDEINTGGTVNMIAQELKKRGAQNIILAATHAVLSGNAIKTLLSSPINTILVSDSIPHTNLPPLFTTIPIASIIAQHLKK
jgi:ribose-phosphate pyrophosphokinase